MPSLFARRIQAFIASHRLLRPGGRILAAVSGGADSVALALVLEELGYPLGVAHLNHGLRGNDSDADERFVQELAERLGSPFFSKTVDLRSIGGNLEAAGRVARHAFFESIAGEFGFDRVALGHHRNDRVETFLFNLTRGSGVAGLTAMSAEAENVVRPLLDVSRRDIEAYLVAQGQVWRTDLTNTELGLARNRMRHVVVPELEKGFNPRVVDTIARTAALLEDEDKWLEELTVDWIERYGVRDGVGFAVDVEALVLAPIALQRRAVRMALLRGGHSLADIGIERVEAVRRLAEPGRSGRVIEIGAGIVAAREFGKIVFRAVAPPVLDINLNLPVPGEISVPELGWTFRTSIVEGSRDVRCDSSERVFVDGVALGPYVRIRPWKLGDYYRPVGWPSGKLKKLFQRARIPRTRRFELPVFVAVSGIVWVASFPVSREFVPSGRSPKIVALEALFDPRPRGNLFGADVV